MEEAIQNRINEIKNLSETEKLLVYSLSAQDLNVIYEKRITAKEVARFLQADHKARELKVDHETWTPKMWLTEQRKEVENKIATLESLNAEEPRHPPEDLRVRESKYLDIRGIALDCSCGCGRKEYECRLEKMKKSRVAKEKMTATLKSETSMKDRYKEDLNMKLSMCKFWLSGGCALGNGCAYAHGLDELGDFIAKEEVRKAKEATSDPHLRDPTVEQNTGKSGEYPPESQEDINEVWYKSLYWKDKFHNLMGWDYRRGEDPPPIKGHNPSKLPKSHNKKLVINERVTANRGKPLKETIKEAVTKAMELMREHFDDDTKSAPYDPFEDIDIKSAADITDLLDRNDIEDLMIFNQLHDITKKNAQEKMDILTSDENLYPVKNDKVQYRNKIKFEDKSFEDEIKNTIGIIRRREGQSSHPDDHFNAKKHVKEASINFCTQLTDLLKESINSQTAYSSKDEPGINIDRPLHETIRNSILPLP